MACVGLANTTTAQNALGVNPSGFPNSCSGEPFSVVFDRPIKAGFLVIVDSWPSGLNYCHEPQTRYGSCTGDPPIIRQLQNKLLRRHFGIGDYAWWTSYAADCRERNLDAQYPVLLLRLLW